MHSPDIHFVLARVGGYTVASCRLGAFQPLSADEAEKLEASSAKPSRLNKKGDPQTANPQPVELPAAAQPRSDSVVPTTTPAQQAKPPSTVPEGRQ